MNSGELNRILRQTGFDTDSITQRNSRDIKGSVDIKPLFNRGGEAEHDADPVVVVVLVLSGLNSRESNTHLGLRSNNRPRQ